MPRTGSRPRKRKIPRVVTESSRLRQIGNFELNLGNKTHRVFTLLVNLFHNSLVYYLDISPNLAILEI